MKPSLAFRIILLLLLGIYYFSQLPEPVRRLPPMASLAELDRLDESQFYNISHTSLAEIDLSSATLCPGDTSFGCRKQLIQLQREVVQDYPIPIPQPNVPALMSTNEAIASYKKYVADHVGEPKLIAFKQLYPRILLNKYSILASNDHSLIRYFTEHMLETHSQDFATLAKTLAILKTDVPASQYNQWLAVTIREAEAQRDKQYSTISALRQRVTRLEKAPDFDQQKNHWISLRVFLKHMETTTISADLAALRKLRQAALQ